jgi:DNA-binding transcriptional MerR regulator
MSNERLTIGELSRRTGVPVKTLRFYSDEGLLPLAGRTSSRYRLYATEALVRIGLIRTLRDAGLSIDSINKVLLREMSLADALRLRLAAVEAHVASLQRVSAALRAALRIHPSEDDLKRIYAVTRLSNEERKAVIERFFDRVSEGIPIDETWKRRMIDATAPKLPDNPTPAQLDAWIELAEIVSDPAFIENLRENAKEVWGKFDMEAMRRAGDEVAAAAKDALSRSVPPESEEAKRIVERYGAALAAAKGGAFDHRRMRQGIRERFARHDPRAARYWELVAILNGKSSMAIKVEEWNWVKAAVLHHFSCEDL